MLPAVRKDRNGKKCVGVTMDNSLVSFQREAMSETAQVPRLLSWQGTVRPVWTQRGNKDRRHTNFAIESIEQTFNGKTKYAVHRKQRSCKVVLKRLKKAILRNL